MRTFAVLTIASLGLFGAARLLDAADWMKGTVTEVGKAEGRDDTDYTIRMKDRQFILRPYATMARRSKAARVFETLGWTSPPQPVHISVPANVGDVVQVQAFGDRAWLLVRNQQYACGIVRQTLLSAPNTPAEPTTPADKADSDSNARPTLRREQ